MARSVIKLNDMVLPPQMIAAEAQHHPSRTPAAAFQAAARALIIRTLLLEEAARQDVEPTPEMIAEGKRETPEEAKIRQLLERSVPIPHVTEKECRDYYDGHITQFRSPELVEASHILFSVVSSDKDAAAKAMSAAQSALEELSRQPGLFESLARERSDCSSKSGGGRLGQLAPGDTVPEFEAALSLLEPGVIAAEPVKTRFGFHILRLDARIAGKPLPFSYVHDKIEAFLGERQWRHGVRQFVGRLVEKAKIEGVDIGTNRTRAA